MLAALLGLWLVPLLGYLIARRGAPAHRGLVTGFCFGSVVAPASMGLYGLYFLGPVAGLVGLLAFPVAALHSEPGYNLAVALDLIPSHTVVRGMQRMYLWLLDGAVWAVVYGGLGAFVDIVRKRRSSSNHERRAA